MKRLSTLLVNERGYLFFSNFYPEKFNSQKAQEEKKKENQLILRRRVAGFHAVLHQHLGRRREGRRANAHTGMCNRHTDRVTFLETDRIRRRNKFSQIRRRVGHHSLEHRGNTVDCHRVRRRTRRQCSIDLNAQAAQVTTIRGLDDRAERRQRIHRDRCTWGRTGADEHTRGRNRARATNIAPSRRQLHQTNERANVVRPVLETITHFREFFAREAFDLLFHMHATVPHEHRQDECNQTHRKCQPEHHIHRSEITVPAFGIGVHRRTHQRSCSCVIHRRTAIQRRNVFFTTSAVAGRREILISEKIGHFCVDFSKSFKLKIRKSF